MTLPKAADYLCEAHFVECCTLLLSSLWWQRENIAGVRNEHYADLAYRPTYRKHFLLSPPLTCVKLHCVSETEDCGEFNEIYTLK